MSTAAVDAVAALIYADAHDHNFWFRCSAPRGLNEDWAHLPTVGREYYRHQARRYLAAAEYAAAQSVDISAGENRQLSDTRR